MLLAADQAVHERPTQQSPCWAQANPVHAAHLTGTPPCCAGVSAEYAKHTAQGLLFAALAPVVKQGVAVSTWLRCDAMTANLPGKQSVTPLSACKFCCWCAVAIWLVKPVLQVLTATAMQ